MKTNKATAQEGGDGTSKKRRIRIPIAVTLVLLLLAYTIAVMIGAVPLERRIDSVHLGLIVIVALVVAALVQPRIFERFRSIKFSGFEMEMLEQVKEKQARQELDLQDVRDLLPLLLTEREQKILRRLETAKTAGWKGGASLRSELRRLRSMRLLVMKPVTDANKSTSKDSKRHVSEIKDDAEYDLADFVELTTSGRRWTQRIKLVEETDDKR